MISIILMGLNVIRIYFKEIDVDMENVNDC